MMLFMIKKSVTLQRSLTKGRRDEAASNLKPLKYDHVMDSQACSWRSNRSLLYHSHSRDRIFACKKSHGYQGYQLDSRHVSPRKSCKTCICHPPSFSLPLRSSSSQHFLSLELSLDGSLQALGLGGGSPSALDLAILANQEFFKVPLDSLQAHETGLLALHPLEDGLGLVAVDVGFAEDGEGDAVVELAELLDGVIVAGVLGAELVAGEAEEFNVVGVGGLEFCEGRRVRWMRRGK